MSNFHFLFEEFSALGRAAQEAERQVYFSPTASCAFSRKALEMALRWMIEHDPEIEVPEGELVVVDGLSIRGSKGEG